MYLTQSLLLDVINVKSKGMKTGFMIERDLKDQNIQDILKFIEFLFLYRVLTQFQGNFLDSRTLESILLFSETSCLWFREFHLGLNESVEVQISHNLIQKVPLSSSLPNLLIDRACKSKKSGSLRYA